MQSKSQTEMQETMNPPTSPEELTTKHFNQSNNTWTLEITQVQTNFSIEKRNNDTGMVRLGHFYVPSEHRRQGWGSAAMDATHKIIKRNIDVNGPVHFSVSIQETEGTVDFLAGYGFRGFDIIESNMENDVVHAVKTI